MGKGVRKTPKDPRIGKRFCENLRRLREDRGETQRGLSRFLGYSDPICGHYERGTLSPKLHVLVRLADHFGVTLDELVGRKP